MPRQRYPETHSVTSLESLSSGNCHLIFLVNTAALVFSKIAGLICPWGHGLRSKKLSVSVAVAPAPVRVPSQRPFALSVTSVANDKGENDMIPGAVYRSPGICLTADENPGKRQQGDRLMKGLCDQCSPQMGSFPANEVGIIAQHVRNEREGMGRGVN